MYNSIKRYSVVIFFELTLAMLCCADSVVVFNEIMYHPVADESQLEWIELYNQMAVDVDMSGWQVRGGIEYDFPEGTVIKGGCFLVLAISPTDFQAEYGDSKVYGPYSGRLSNSGEELILKSNSKRVMDTICYGTSGDWSAACDGSGASLAKKYPDSACTPVSNWRASIQVGGTPGEKNFPGQMLSEAVDLLTMNTIWKYNDVGMPLDSTWKNIDFDDSQWSENGALFYNSDAIFGFPKVTAISSEANTSYFRTTFEFDGDPSATLLELSHFVDDGALFYLNGQQIYGINMADGVMDYYSNADIFVEDALLVGPVLLASSGLVHGTNVLAVEVHQAGTSLIATGGDDGDGRVPDNLALLSNGATAFAKDCIGGGSYAPTHTIPNLNDGIYGNSNSWIGNSETSFAGVSFASPQTINRIAFGRDNGGEEYVFTDRCIGTYLLQYTTVSEPDETTSDMAWNDIVTLEYITQFPDSTPWVRHVYQFNTVENVTGVRVIVNPLGICLDELEVYYEDDAEDMVFGCQLSSRHILSSAPEILFNEIASADSIPFGVEIMNCDQQSFDLSDCVIVLDGEVNYEYIFPSGTLNSLEHKAIYLNISADAGDKLFLYTPDRKMVLDGIVIEDRVKGRFPDGKEMWCYPDRITMGLSNSFSFHDEIVINEIMYHPAPMIEQSATKRLMLVSAGSVAKTLVPRDNTLGFTWTGGNEPFDDLLWNDGVGDTMGIGYETDTGGGPYQSLIGTNILSAMYNINSTIYIRIPFDLDSSEDITSLMLKMKYDDGFIAYLNGLEVKRVNFNVEDGPVWNSQASVNHPDSEAVVYQYYDITDFKSVLRLGTNILTIHGLNQAINSSDMLILSELEAEVAVDEERPSVMDEWIEIYNRSDKTVDLSGWKLDDEVEYEFPQGVMIAPHDYIVIAEDSNMLLQLYPGLTIYGDFNGSLSNSDGRVLLLDEYGNPADQVHYYDGGRWPEHADGYWASLELKNPLTDNAKPDSWSASSEIENSSWQTISYKGIAAQDFGTAVWNELLIGMLDGGAVLLDDISVVEDPDGSAIELVQNGTFEYGTADKWRIIGNHRHSKVVIDPENSSNHALMLTSSGAMDFRHNHAETTFVNNRNIVDGREYQISFRARWVAGTNQLNVRLYYIRLAKSFQLDVPRRYGTPGSINSCYQPNMGPVLSELGHSPVIPSVYQSTTISITAEDADGVDMCTVWYSTNGSPWQNKVMKNDGNGRFSSSLPGCATAATVQFYVEATDSCGTISVYPEKGPDSRALYIVQDGKAMTNGIHNLRAIMTAEDVNFMFVNTNLMSNERLGATIIYDEKEVFYDVGIRLKGSPAGRARDGDDYISYNIEFNNDQPFRGVHSSVAIDRSGRSPVVRGQDEIYIKHMFNKAGVPSMYDDLVNFIAPKSVHTGTALLMMARYEDVYLGSQWKNGEEGTVYNWDLTYHPVSTIDGDPEHLKPPIPENSLSTDMKDLGSNKETYRSPFEIRNNRRSDDFSGLINFCKTMSLPTEHLQEQIFGVMDVDEWLRYTALLCLCGIGDAYGTGGLFHNIRLYCRPEDQKMLALPWDMDFVFLLAYNAPLWPVNGTNLQRVIELTENKRLYYGHVKDLVDNVFNTSYMRYWLDSYDDLLPNQTFTNQLWYIQSRGSWALNQLPVKLTFEVTDPDFTVDADFASVNGQAWVNVKEICLEGYDKPLKPQWTSSGAGTSEHFYWQVNVPVEPGENLLTFLAYDFQGNHITTDSITVTSTLAARPLRDNLRITEIMYDPPADSDYEFIELCNTGSELLDLADVVIGDAINDFSFGTSGVTSLDPGQFVVVVKDRVAFESVYGAGLNVAGQFTGKLANEGERITIKGRYGTPIVSVEYNDGREWPLSADGSGHSLVPLDDAIAGQANGTMNYGLNWRASTYINGSPCASDPEPPMSVVLNEIMAHTDLNDPGYPHHDSNDWIELYNPTDSVVILSAGCWYLSDDKDWPAKWQIPEKTIPSHSWVSFDEITGFHLDPLSGEGFGLDKAGEAVLLSYLPETGQGRVVDTVRFKGQENNTSLGRFPNGTPFWQAMIPSRDNSNNTPLTHAMITEIMYHPLSEGKEYIEIFNPTPFIVSLWDPVTVTGWRVGGAVEYRFPQTTIIEPFGYLLVVGFEPDTVSLAEFEDMYGNVPCQIFGPYTGLLSNGGERLALEKPQAPDNIGDSISWVIVDEVIYFDQAPWSFQADGLGYALSRNRHMLYGNDSQSWSFSLPNPGTWEADFDRNGDVNIIDFALLSQSWMTERQNQYWNPQCDLSRPPDGFISLDDLYVFTEQW